MTAVIFAFSGAVAGIAQITLLARTAREQPHPLSLLVRLVLVAVVLLVAAKAGLLLTAALGWMVGFFAFVAIEWRRLK